MQRSPRTNHRFSSPVWLALFVLAALIRPAFAADEVPQWIWSGKSPAENEEAFFRKPFEMAQDVAKAELRGIADQKMTVFVNGRQAAEIEGYKQMVRVDVRDLLRSGGNVLALRCLNDAGPAGAIVVLDLTFADDSRQRIATDETWLATPLAVPRWQEPDFEPRDWTKAVSFGELGVQPWGDPTGEVDDYNQWKQAIAGLATDPRTLVLPDGFQADLLRSAQPDEGSWVSMEFDPSGRLIVAREKQGLLRLSFSEDRSAVRKVEVIDDTLLECRGLLCANNCLYANANNSKALYRLRDTDGDDRYDEVQPLMETSGGVGHGRNDLAQGPDRLVYVAHGNNVLLPDGLSDRSPLRNFALDRLLPTPWNDQLFDAGVMPPGGCIVRVDGVGVRRELFCGGFRNEFGLAFNADGELFTYDSDMEWDAGAPWYKPTRLYHLVSGGDYGWRQGTEVWPGWYADTLPPLLDVGKGSPTAVMFGTQSSFPPKYRQALFILDWSYGRILAVHLTPRGASYAAEMESFCKGRPLNVTDLDFGPDGAMYFITGGRGTQSGLYRVRYAGPPVEPAPLSPDEQSRLAEAAQARALRRSLAAYHGRRDARALIDAWPHLDSTDPYLRHAARLAVESQPLATWQEKVLREQRPVAALTALLALARLGPSSLQGKLLDRLLTIPADRDESQQLLALRAYAVCFARMGRPDPAAARRVLDRLSSWYPGGDYPLNHQLSELLVYLDDADVVAKTMAAIARAGTQEEQLHDLFVLRNMQRGWTPELRRTYVRWLARAGTFDGAQYMPTFIAHIKSDWLAGLSDDERRDLAAELAALEKPVIDELPSVIPRPFVKQWALADLAGALGRVGGGRDFARGKTLYAAALCNRCHRLGREGTAFGPDLTSVSARFNRRDLLESILAPSKIVDEKYRNLSIVTKDGAVIVGRLVGGDERSLILSVNPLQPSQTVQVAKDDIEAQEPSLVSPMPQGLLNTFTEEEILDLLAAIEAAGVGTGKLEE